MLEASKNVLLLSTTRQQTHLPPQQSPHGAGLCWQELVQAKYSQPLPFALQLDHEAQGVRHGIVPCIGQAGEGRNGILREAALLQQQSAQTQMLGWQVG